MRVACVDNMNHMMFSLTRHLRDRGIDAELVLHSDGYPHFAPEADAFGTAHEDYTRHLRMHYLLGSRRALESAYGRYDLMIGAGYTPLLCERMRRVLDIFVPHGSDLYKYPLAPFAVDPNGLRNYVMGRMQKRGIERSRFVFMDYTNDELERVWSRFNLSGRRVVMQVPFLYAKQYWSEAAMRYQEQSPAYNTVKALRMRNELVVFHHSSHQWRDGTYPPSQKRNDILIRGFAEFAREYPAYPACLVMVEYGPDVDGSKRLVAQLGIGERVCWLPLSPRKDLLLAMKLSDLGAGEFGNSWFSYCVIFEFLAMGKPVMHRRDNELYTDIYESLYPMYTARSAQDVADVLRQFRESPECFRRVGKASADWFNEYVIRRPVEWFSEVIAKGAAK